MYRVRNVERHRYRKIPRCNSPSAGEHNAACRNTQRRRVRTTWIVALGRGTERERIAHQRRGSWQTGRLSVEGRAEHTWTRAWLGSSTSVPQSRQRALVGQDRGAAPKDTRGGWHAAGRGVG